MKATYTEPNFNPVTISITLETEEELNEFYVLFNYAPITNIMGNIDDGKIRDILNKAHGERIAYTETFAIFEEKLAEFIGSKE